MNHVRKTAQHGFTLVELTLSMAFISMLLLAIAMLTMQISAIYNKGLTVRAVNESGQQISSNIQRTLNSTIPTEVLSVEDANLGGRLCANNIVYAWNYAGHITSNTFGGNQNRYSDGSYGIRLVRFVGDTSYCRNNLGPYKLIPKNEDTVELLSPGDRTLAVHSLTIPTSSIDDKPGEPVVGDGKQRIYSISLRLGSNDQGILEDTGCRTPISKVDDTYCSINTFKFTARAGNRGAS